MTAPRYLHFQLTERCNLACPGCYLPERAGRGADPADIEDTVFAPLAEAGVRLATLTGGEPLLHPRWREVCAAAARHFENVQLVCNGTLLDLAAYEALAEAGVHAVKVSLDGPTPAVHDALRGQQGCFTRVTANLRAIADLPDQARGGVNLGCICTVYPQNAGLLRETADLVAGLGLDSMLFQPYHPFGFLYPRGEPLRGPVSTDRAFLETLASQLERLRELRRSRPGFLDNSLHMLERFPEFYTEPQGPEQVCGADRFVFVNSAFEARGCLFCEPLGSLRGQTLPELLRSGAWQGFDAFRRACRRCLMGCQFVDKAQDLAEEGFARLDAKDAAGALERFDASLALEYSVSAAHGAGAARLLEERRQEALPLLEGALAHQPRNALLNADLGWALLELGELDAARARFDASLALGYTPVAGHGAGMVRLRQGDPREARRFLLEALSLRLDNPMLMANLGWALLELGEMDAARDMFEASLARGYTTVAVHGAGMVRLRQGDPREAHRLLLEALSHRPDDPILLADRGWVLHKLDDLDGAKAAFDASLARGYTTVAGHGAGLIRHLQGDSEAALPFLEEALRQRPDNVFILQDLGLALIRLGRWDALPPVYGRLLDLDPENATGHRFRGLDARRAGDLQAALPDLRAALKACDPQDPWPAFEVGLTCLDLGLFEEAARCIGLAASRDPGFPWFRYRLAQALDGLGRRAEALEACREALRLDPGPEPFHRLREDLERRGGA